METYIKGTYKRCIFSSNDGYVIGLIKIKETDDQDLLENNGLEMVTKFTYENILTVKEVLPYSDIEETNDAIKIAITIPTVSYQSKSLIKNIVFIPKAINNIFIIGSDKVSNNNLKKVSLFFFVRELLPYFFLFLITSSLVRPFLLIIIAS